SQSNPRTASTPTSSAANVENIAISSARLRRGRRREPPSCTIFRRTPMDINFEKSKGETSEWRTPGPSLLDRIGLVYGLDPCAPTSGYYAVRARTVFTVVDNGLVRPWRGYGLVFVNPPWSEERRAVVPWLRKFFAEADGGIFVCVARTSADWFHELVL